MTANTPPGPYTLVSQAPRSIVRLVQEGTLVTVQEFRHTGSLEIPLDATALRAFLQALPRATVLQALGGWSPLEQLQACWRAVDSTDRARFLIERLTPAERVAISYGLEEDAHNGHV